jgi:hypothetical protein
MKQIKEIKTEKDDGGTTIEVKKPDERFNKPHSKIEDADNMVVLERSKPLLYNNTNDEKIMFLEKQLLLQAAELESLKQMMMTSTPSLQNHHQTKDIEPLDFKKQQLK